MTRAAELAKIIGKGSVDIHGEAGTTSSGSTGKTTNLQQGLAKAWMNLDGSGTIAILDSFNVSGATDNGTGEYTQTHTNAMNNALYSVAISSKRSTSSNRSGSQHQDGTFTTAAFRMLFVEFDNDPSHDVDMAFTMVAGDLA
jgi:hypothetical protein